MGKIKSIVSQVRKQLSRFRKVKQVRNKAQPKKMKQQAASIVVYLGLILLFVVGLFGGLRAIGLSSQVGTMSHRVKQFEQTVSSLSQNDTQLDISRVRAYLSDFLKVYINYEEGVADERLKKLEDYYSFSMAGYVDLIKTPRSLTGQSLIGVRREGEFYIADMKLSYETVENAKKVSRVRVLAIPFKIEEHLLSIVSPPYFKKEENMLGEAESLERKQIDAVERVEDSVETSVREFLPVFFDKYALSNEVDLSLLMKEPFLMGGQYVVDSIQESSLLIYEEKEQIVVQVSVDFADKGNGAIHTENFTIYLLNQDSGWYVEKLFHYFKE